MSISEIASKAVKSYTFVRNNLISSQTQLRSKADGTRQHIKNHPDWSRQFIKYEVKSKVVTDDKILLLAMIITEGYTDRTSAGFTNTQLALHDEFRSLVEKTYGPVHFGTNNLTTRISSTEVSKDISQGMVHKAFSEPMFARVLSNRDLTRRVLRIVADTEGSMIISPKKSPRNFSVECRVVLASKNRAFNEQVALMLSNVGIVSHIGTLGVNVTAKPQIRKFIEEVGFSEGIKVIRKKAGQSTWYGKEKSTLSRLCLDIYRRQGIARASGRRGCFEQCKTREDTMSYLNEWYSGVSGGE
ncbi:MAG: LAGLIDADG family homing endonuclease [Thaumarchaeota archaeon]|nr:LAGLIDADG family homing endonuclease [Nitrososphaerota archaeon]